MLVAKPQTNHLINALSGLDDHDPADRAERYRIEREFADQARRHQQGNDDLAVKTARWEMKHTACPPGTALPPEPKVPDDLPVMHRLSEVQGREVGVPRTVILGG